MNRQHVDMYLTLKDLLVAMARKSAQRGSSYREFFVGCAVLAYNGRVYRIFRGVNLYPIKGETKVCAEQSALGAARACGFDFLVAIVVAGDAQRDGESDISSPTLHPCGNCRRLLQSLPEVQGDTIVYTVGRGQRSPTEEHTVKEILRLHNSR